MSTMVRFRVVLLPMLLAGIVVGCTNSPGTTDEATTTTMAPSPSSDSLELGAANARIAELEAELFTATSTTTSTLPSDFVVFSHETGEYIIEPAIAWVWGWVSNPQATVDVNNQALAVGDFSNPWWDFGPPDDEEWSIPLREGRNMLMFTATFPDGQSQIDDIVVYHDPTLTRELGILTGYEPDEPRTMSFDIGTEYQQDAGGGITVESSATYPVADNAVVKVEALNLGAWTVMDNYGFFDLMDFMRSGECELCLDDGECCPNRCIWASWDGGEGLEFAIFLNTDGEIQQLTQLHLRN